MTNLEFNFWGNNYNYYDTVEDLRDQINRKSLNTHNPFIDYDELKGLCCYLDPDGNQVWMGDLSDICREHYVKYGDELKYISYFTLINNYEIINFPYLLTSRHFQANSFFIKVFRLIEFYPNILSSMIRFTNHAELIEEYKDHPNLNWDIIVTNNFPISSSNIQKYYEYIRKCKSFFFDKHQTFTKEDVLFIINADIEKTQSLNSVLTSPYQNIEYLFKTHKFSEEDLSYIVENIKRIKFDEEKKQTLSSMYIAHIRHLILETQNYTENLLLQHKGFFRQYWTSACIHGNLSEDFINNNPKYIDWACLSQNQKLLNGKYSDDFYYSHALEIKWKLFNADALKNFYKNDKEKFKDFFIKFYTYIEPDNSGILSMVGTTSICNEGPYTESELPIYFGELIREFSPSEKFVMRMNESFASYFFKTKYDSRTFITFLEDGDYTLHFVKNFKKRIFEILLSEDTTKLSKRTKEKLNKLIEELKEQERK